MDIVLKFILCQSCIHIACSHSELCVFKVMKLDLQVTPVFVDPVAFILSHCTCSPKF